MTIQVEVRPKSLSVAFRMRRTRRQSLPAFCIDINFSRNASRSCGPVAETPLLTFRTQLRFTLVVTPARKELPAVQSVQPMIAALKQFQIAHTTGI